MNLAICLKDRKGFIKGKVYKAGDVVLGGLTWSQISVIDENKELWSLNVNDEGFCFVINHTEDAIDILLDYSICYNNLPATDKHQSSCNKFCFQEN